DHLSHARHRLAEEGCGVPAVEARTRYGWIREAVKPCLHRDSVRPTTWTDRLDRILTHRVWGTLVFLLVMLRMFVSIFWSARPFMRAIEAGRDWVAGWIGPPSGLLGTGALTSLLTDGLLTGVGSVLVFLPQILILFGFIAVLEDCGYMARAAYLMD